MSDIETLLDNLKQRFNASAARGLEAVYQYQLTDDGAFYAAIDDSGCTLSQGEHEDPSVTLTMNRKTFDEILDGSRNGMQAFMTGKVKAQGNFMLATRLEALFPAS